MTNLKSTRRALFTSVIAFVLCFSMLLGTTYAWFTDSVTSTGNIIQTGNLKIDLLVGNTLDDGSIEWVSIKEKAENEESTAIFGYNNWEPGYTEVKTVKVVNEGSLALQFMLNIIPSIAPAEGEANLADVIEVYVADGQHTFTREELTDTSEYYKGELSSLMNDADGAAYGKLVSAKNANEANGEYSEIAITIALKMKESAGNEYQDKSVGGAFAVQLLATQLASEFDSFDEKYDAEAKYPKNVVATADDLVEALENGEDAFFVENIKIDPANMSNAYGKTGLNVTKGQTIDGNGYTLDVAGAGGTWDSGINTTGGVIKNLTVTGSFRGIFVNHNSTHSERVILENVTIDGTTYTISCDQGKDQGLTATNSTFKGWTSYAATLGDAEFNNCYFGEGNGYSYCRPFARTTFTNCEFEAGFTLDPRAAVVLENCTLGGELITAENLADLVVEDYLTNVTVLNDGKIGVTSADAFAKAIANGYTEIELAAGNYTMPEPGLRGKTLTIVGTKDTVIDVSAVNENNQFVTGATIVFDGVTLNFGNNNNMGFANTASLTYKNCQINGLQFLYGENVTFENCDLNSNGAEHTVWTYGAKNVSFTDCDFIYDDRGINCYSHNDIPGGKQTVNFTNCTFTTDNTDSEGAVEINSTYFSVGIEVNMEGCTAPAYGEMAYVSPWDSTEGAKTTINIK